MQSAVKAVKVLDKGYLYSTKLEDEVLRKLPNAIISNYIRYAAHASEIKSNLEKISDFLDLEAQMMIKAGIITDYSYKSRGEPDRPARDHHNQGKNVYVNATDGTQEKNTNSLKLLV